MLYSVSYGKDKLSCLTVTCDSPVEIDYHLLRSIGDSPVDIGDPCVENLPVIHLLTTSR